MSLYIRLFGDLELIRDGKRVDLPASRKTRALLAFLVVTGRPQRRERLCELFWDLPDDPRGALRWSLSKLRSVINDPGIERLTGDRERIAFDGKDVVIDLDEIRSHIEIETASANSLTKGISLMLDEFLGGVDLPDNPEFSAWLAAERERVARIRDKAAKRLIEHKDTTPDQRLAYARQWLEARPFNRDAADAIVAAHVRLGDRPAAANARRELSKRFSEVGINWAPLIKRPQEDETPNASGEKLLAKQEVRFCKTRDNATIAYAAVGTGPPLVKAANWLTHLELDWNAPIWSPLFQELARDHRFIRYDERGCGLSDWDVPDISLETFVDDLETIVDALKLERFPLLGISQGAAVSIEYAVRHPERVSHLILFGGYAAGWRMGASKEVIAEREAVMTLTRSGWGRDNPAYRHIFSSTFMPGATAEQLAWFDEFQRQTTSAENAVRFLSAFGDIDVRDKLAHVSAPTLVLHSRRDRRIPWETGRDIATAIPNARLVTLDSDNHLLLEGEPAAAEFVDAVRAFLEEQPGGGAGTAPSRGRD